MHRIALKITGFCLAVFAGQVAHADTINVAVASNFAVPAREIAAAFAERTGHDVRVSTGSTGHLYAQILNGAPYDVFLAADSRRPALLEEDGVAVSESRRTYALGQLAFWSRDPAMSGAQCVADKLMGGDGRFAIANPALAPYGAAAAGYLRESGTWSHIESRLVLGENISQALHFAASGNASVAIVAQSQLAAAAGLNPSCVLPIDAARHAEITQQAVLLRRGGDAGKSFLDFLRSEDALSIMRRHGYRLPELF